jgi:hypothetical protein
VEVLVMRLCFLYPRQGYTSPETFINARVLPFSKQSMLGFPGFRFGLAKMAIWGSFDTA